MAVPKRPLGDADVVMRLGHAARQTRLLVRRQGQRVVHQRGLKIAAEIGDDPQIVEAPRLRGMIAELPREVQRRGKVPLRPVTVSPLQRDRSLVVARPQLRVPFPLRPRPLQRRLRPPRRLVVSAQAAVRFRQKQGERRATLQIAGRQGLERTQDLAVASPLRQAP